MVDTSAWLTPKNIAVAIWATIAIVAGVGQTVTLAISLEFCMSNFAFWVFWATAVPFVIVFFIVLAFFQFATNQITPEMRQIPHKKWMIIGLLTMLNGTFLLFSGPHVDGVLQALLGPTVVVLPMCMLFAFFYLKIRYSYGQLFGVAVIVAGVFVALLPSFLGQTTSSGTKQSAFWAILWVLGSVPQAMLYVYEEEALSEEPIHMAHLMAWSTLYQLISIIVIGGPLSLIPGFGGAGPSTFFEHQWEAFQCFAGTVPPSCPDCVCSKAASYVSQFTFYYITTNYANLGVLKNGSATLAFVVSTIITPLSAIAFSVKGLLGQFAGPLSTLNYIALVVLLVGVIIYRGFELQNTRAKNKAAKAEEERGLVQAALDEEEQEMARTVSFGAYGPSPIATVVRDKKKVAAKRERARTQYLTADNVHGEADYEAADFWSM